MDGHPKRQAKRDELCGAGEEVPYRPTDSKAVRAVAAESSVLQTHEIGAYPFSPQGAGLSMTAPAAPIAWDMAHGAAAYPVAPRRTGRNTVIRLLPYGCTNLRVTEFPLIADDAQ